ncbi:helical backbone metal receptor [Ornithinimicrobium pekingense]|uniref:ABC transporter substrate-binding protein n=1 Tax=Ornithinimicrobium pekingense TaxID=384677 RepID=A0ABQ2F939_9MICO|nr:helical backbone metal receptor [Ornithinimicrobium pekingense]GGK69706.1 ABC transporter substrate-binding protein [Ornithinimicrobium pekingense]
MARTLTDHLGTTVTLPDGPVRRVVSLVPSLTEAVAVTRREALVGATDWCTHPADLDVARVRGTKNPDRAAVEALAPELVLCVQEENRELDVERLRAAGVPVWVSVVESVPQALASMHRLFEEVLAWGVPDWLADVEEVWGGGAGADAAEHGSVESHDAARPPVRARVAVAVWRDPWMVVGSRTFTGDLLRRSGLANVHEDHEERYPTVALEELDSAGADVILLPDEPYEFTPEDGPEAFANTPTQLVSGRLLTWYGPSMLEAADLLAAVPAQP